MSKNLHNPFEHLLVEARIPHAGIYALNTVAWGCPNRFIAGDIQDVIEQDLETYGSLPYDTDIQSQNYDKLTLVIARDDANYLFELSASRNLEDFGPNHYTNLTGIVEWLERIGATEVMTCITKTSLNTVRSRRPRNALDLPKTRYARVDM